MKLNKVIIITPSLKKNQNRFLLFYVVSKRVSVRFSISN